MINMKYKCLVLDHDDTVVDSTATIHYPCFIEYLKLTRPHLLSKYSLDTYFIKNFSPGITELFRDEIGMDEEEIEKEVAFWSDYVKNHIPPAYSGIKEIIAEFRARGGIIAVNSHSLREYIERDYIHNGLPMPDVIYSWDLPEGQRKPSPYTLFDLMKRYSLSKDEIIVVDDLKPGYDMARGAGVAFAAAGWAYDIPEIERFMRKNCDFYLKQVSDLYKYLFL
jgi:phosphoglycolate phosphatase/pyrophosphatase PpaX